MFSRILLLALAATPLAVSRAFEAVHYVEIQIRQATTTAPGISTYDAACTPPSSLFALSVYEGQPTGSPALDDWMRAIPCDNAACCVPASLSADWASYTSDSDVWWSAHASAIAAHTSAIASWYSSAAQLPACATIVHPVTFASTPNPSTEWICPTATGSTQTSTSPAGKSTGLAVTSRSVSPSSSPSSSVVVESSSAGVPIGSSFCVGSSFSYVAVLFSIGVFTLAIGL